MENFSSDVFFTIHCGMEIYLEYKLIQNSYFKLKIVIYSMHGKSWRHRANVISFAVSGGGSLWEFYDKKMSITAKERKWLAK